MSITHLFSGKTSKPQITTLTGAYQTVYTPGKGGAILSGFAAVNATGVAITLDVAINDGSSDLRAWYGSIPANSTTIMSDLADLLPDGYTIKALGNGLVFRPIAFAQSPNASASYPA